LSFVVTENLAAALAANQPATVNLPPGQYRWAITTVTAVYASLSRVPVG